MNEFLEQNRIIRALQSFRSSLSIANTFEHQMAQIKRLLKQDNTGLVTPILDFHIQAASVPFKIESYNDTLNTVLDLWQKRYLNSTIGNDIPRGLNALTVEHHRERLTSSFIVLRILWEEKDFGGDLGKWIIPMNMYLMDGASVRPGKETSNLKEHQYFIRDNSTKYGTLELKARKDETIIIRKPFNSFYEMMPTPYLVRRGVMWNALFKQLILDKQSTSMEQLIPYLLLMTAGSQKLAEAGIQTTEGELKEFKNSLLTAIKEHDYTGEIGKLIAAINGDVKMEHFLPEFSKLTDPKITEACDTNILSGLGLIELSGFSNTRKEAIMNPQVFVTDVTDTIMDWKDILTEVMYQMTEKNEPLHRNLTNNEIRVIPGTIKTFLTDKMKTIISLAHDKGNIPTEDYLNDVLNKNLNDVLERSKKEKENGVREILTPRQTQVFQQKQNNTPSNDDPEGTKEEQGKKPGSVETQQYKNASLATCPKCKESIDYNKEPEAGMGYIKCPNCKEAVTQKDINAEITVDTIPQEIAETLPSMGAKVIFAKSYNVALKEGKEPFSAALESLQEKYIQKNNKWVKK